MKHITLHLYTDPGHGWLKVPMRHPVFQSIKEKVSHYSYVRGEYAYLEHDCDASLFILALNEHGYSYRIRIHGTDRRSKIRSYDNYYYISER